MNIVLISMLKFDFATNWIASICSARCRFGLSLSRRGAFYSRIRLTAMQRHCL